MIPQLLRKRTKKKKSNSQYKVLNFKNVDVFLEWRPRLKLWEVEVRFTQVSPYKMAHFLKYRRLYRTANEFELAGILTYLYQCCTDRFDADKNKRKCAYHLYLRQFLT